MKRYLKGSTHYLTEDEASHYPTSWNNIKLEKDGTYSVYHLASEPVQKGQAEYKII